MADTPPAEPGPRVRNSWMALVPIVFFVVLALAFVLLVRSVGTVEVASGPAVVATWKSSCSHADIDRILQARARAMGLPVELIDLETRMVHLGLTLPAAESDIRRIPEVLARTGRVVVSDASSATLADNTNLASTGVEIDLAGMPTTMLRFDAPALRAMSESLRSGLAPLQVTIDGELVASYADLPDLDEGYIELPSGDGPTRGRMLVAADRSIVLGNGPLPCALSLSGVVLGNRAG